MPEDGEVDDEGGEIEKPEGEGGSSFIGVWAASTSHPDRFSQAVLYLGCSKMAINPCPLMRLEEDAFGEWARLLD
jgi:hypothetical protein